MAKIQVTIVGEMEVSDLVPQSGALVMAFLNDLSTDEIDQEAMGRMGWDSDATLTGVILTILREKAQCLST